MSALLIIALIVGAVLVFRSQTPTRRSNEAEPRRDKSGDALLDDLLKATQSPTGTILTWAFNLSSDTDALLRKKLPEITRYPNLKDFGNLLQAATIIATLIRIERHLGDIDHATLHKNIVQSINPSVRGAYMRLLKDLTGFLLKTDSNRLPDDTLPSLNQFIKEDEEVVAMTIAFWVVGCMKMAKPEDSDAGFVNSLGGIIYKTNAKLIASMYLSGGKSMTTEFVNETAG